MNWSDALRTYFPEALPAATTTREVSRTLKAEGFSPDSTLLATSTCPDELNRSVTHFEENWGPAFHLGGLAGVPFTGRAGFSAFGSHIPDDGRAFILYASHVGITADGELGRTVRRHQSHTTLSCGSAVGAYLDLQKGRSPEELEGQQQYVARLIERHLAAIESHAQPMAVLPEVVYRHVDTEIKQLIPDEFEHETALLGGIQINTPEEEEDYFLVREFSVQQPAEKLQISLRGRLSSKDEG